MKYLLAVSVLALGACVHTQDAAPPVYNAQSAAPAQSTVIATCADGFNASVDHLMSAMEIEGTYAFAEPAIERPTAYESRISRF